MTYQPSSTCMLRVRDSAGSMGQRLWKLWWSEGVGTKPALVSIVTRSLSNSWFACLIP